MSVATEISRIQADKNTIRNKLVELGLATGTANLDVLAAVIADIVKHGQINANVKEGESYTIPAGYHDGTGTVKGVSGGGNYLLQTGKRVTPTKQQQSVTSDDGYYGLDAVTVEAIPNNYQDVSNVNAVAGDVLSGKIIVLADGTVVAGTMPNNGAVSQTLNATVVSYTIPKGYHSGTGTVKITLETKTVTPTKSTQNVTPSSGKLLSKVTVNPIPDNYIDTTDASATAEDILDGETAYVDGVKVEGSMPNNGSTSGSIDGLTTTSVSIPAGYTSGGTVSLTDDIETQLAAI